MQYQHITYNSSTICCRTFVTMNQVCEFISYPVTVGAETQSQCLFLYVPYSCFNQQQHLVTCVYNCKVTFVFLLLSEKLFIISTMLFAYLYLAYFRVFWTPYVWLISFYNKMHLNYCNCCLSPFVKQFYFCMSLILEFCDSRFCNQTQLSVILPVTSVE